MLRIGSLFSGSGGFELAAAICGIKPTWASEVEPFPIRVTTKRFPNMKHLGDISKINGAEIEPVDVITFGSPCQDLSVAGKRKGLNHSELGDEETTRSGLFMEAVRIIREMKEATNGQYPTFAVWENVPGAYSSNKGEDFRIVLEELEKTACNGADIVPKPPKGKWLNAGEIVGDNYSIAWRTLDAQFWGVPQRRRRIYLVADFRGKRAGKILFEREGLRGNFTQSGTPWQGTAGNAEKGTGAADRAECVGFDSYNLCLTGDKGRTVTTPSGGLNEHIPCVLLRNKEKCYAVENHPADSRVNIDDSGKVQTLTSRMGTGGGNEPLVMEPQGIDGYNSALTGDKSSTLGVNCGMSTGRNGILCYSLDRAAYNQGINAQYDIGIDDSGTAHTLVAKGPGAVCYWNGEQVSGTLTANNAGGGQRMPDKDNFNCIIEKKPQLASGNAVTGCLMASGYDKLGAQEMFSGDYTVIDAKEPHYIVRRLTPLECCRLQGFPDWWCSNLETENPTESDIEFWREVFETHRTVISGTSKPKTDKQIIKWLKDPYSDSAIYKMWGNGIALPNALFVMQGIAEELCREVGENELLRRMENV